jgi:queuine tRNA-ribosyltransferase
MAVTYELIKKCPKTGARAGRLYIPTAFSTPHLHAGWNPGHRQSDAPHELAAMGAGIILSNTYHLFLRPGHDLVAEAGGLHTFMRWDRGILTDSGGFQVSASAAAQNQRGRRSVPLPHRRLEAVSVA